ncbi:UDP-glucose 6-dehydrogenase [candidate division LCP-89 bacterium B3_LCP]|uniref:UDP-glucose 6-dehydrogenase n=1 Tax=candidate division LCP-89 bacterium B3_LCP TaxID=2012998 RepID=A0A532V574_UNCL8|nr:MAG: UDP-glucose 6-dehydrogenase [candidate division LCP-89 bacterium B3_LCP]
MKICVIGTGYVGLVAGTCFAETGNDVICVDVDKRKIKMLKKGIIPIYEPGLKELVDRNTKKGRLSFTTDLDASVKESLINFIAVGTPPDEDGSSDLTYVLAVAKSIGQSMNGYKAIVDKSTVPVGTADQVRETIRAETDHPFDVVSNPEFLKEGAAIDDFMRPDRVVIGVDDSRVEALMKDLYSPFVRTGHPIIIMDVKSAEMTKYASNAILATKISFMNEMSNLCEKIGANVTLVRQGIGADQRIGHQFLFPGVGYGGSCFPKDIKALIYTAQKHEMELQILKSVEDVNERQKHRLVEKVRGYFGDDLSGKLFGLWGLSFKPRTDDMREAPSIVIIDGLIEAGAKVQAYDPQAMDEARRILGDKITLVGDEYEATNGVDALLIVTEWNEFREPNFETLQNSMKSTVIFDGRNIYDSNKMAALGFTYYSLGRSPVNGEPPRK